MANKNNKEEKTLNYSLRLLGIKPRSVHELKQKLLKKGFGPELTDKILLKLAGENYLNDEEFTRLFIKERTELKSLGKRRIKAELVFKGIDREIIETAFDGYNTEDEFEKALVLAQKKLNSLNGLAPTTQKRRLSQFLLRRGFDFEMVLGLCRKLIND